MVGFKLPLIEDNQEGWGPTTVPEKFASVPFMPFGKGDRLGRIADFTAQPGRVQYQSRYNREPAPGAAVFNFEKTEEDEAFELVDNKPVKKPAGMQQRRPQQQQQRTPWGQQGGRGGGPAGQQQGAGGRGNPRYQQQGGRGQPFRQPWRDQPRAQYTSSVEIRPEWQVIGDQIALPVLHKLTSTVGEPQEITSVGAIPVYDRAADRVTPKTPAKLRRPSNRARHPSMFDDSVIRKLANDGVGTVFMSDAILTALMCAPRSVLPWDVVITRRGGVLFLDRRPGSSLEFLTNGETAPEAPTEERDNVNGMQQLSVEATMVNQSFREQVLAGATGQAEQLGAPLPAELANSGTPAPGFRYRKWTLGNIELVVRCEIDACLKVGDSVQHIAIHALNEFDPKWAGVDWRQKLENQRGAVLATELKNNANKIAKWTASAIIGGIDLIKLGYVSRVGWKDAQNHVLLGTQAVKPKDFASQMNLNMDNCWGIVRALLDLCINKMEEDGKYLLLRDANKPQLRLYAIPTEAALEPEQSMEEDADEDGNDDE